jgi:hypothetical protein
MGGWMGPRSSLEVKEKENILPLPRMQPAVKYLLIILIIIICKI